MIEEALESPGFYILGFGGSIMAILGWMMSKNMGWTPLPLWQLIVMVVVILIASAFFATKD